MELIKVCNEQSNYDYLEIVVLKSKSLDINQIKGEVQQSNIENIVKFIPKG